MYRRVAVAAGLLGVIAIIIGIVFYSGKHTARGLTAVIIGVLLLIVAGITAYVERRDRQRRGTRGSSRDFRYFR